MNYRQDGFFEKMAEEYLALVFDDVSLRTSYSEILPRDVILSSKFSRNINLNIPFVSSPMDRVTEWKMLVAMALEGGLGIAHKGMKPKDQAAMVRRAKLYLSAIVVSPICVRPDQTMQSVLEMRESKEFSFYSFPVLNEDGKLVGVITGNDFKRCIDKGQMVSDYMSTNLVTTRPDISVQEAYEKMVKEEKSLLPIIDNGELVGIYTISDVIRTLTGNPEGYNLDKQGRLVVGAAINAGGDIEERMELLKKSGVDVVVVDSAHGNSKNVVEAVRFCKLHYPGIDVVAGNITDADGAQRLMEAGADGLRVGQGSGSICTTRVVSGIGVPQLTAVHETAKKVRGIIPVCSDGGIKESGDVVKALAAGAMSVMIGSRFASCSEAPGRIINVRGVDYKEYRGMGSLDAMVEHQSSRERYFQGDEKNAEKLVPEGISGMVKFTGPVSKVIFQLVGGLRSGMGYQGARDIAELQEKAMFIRVTNSGLREAHPHDIEYIQDSPNYRQ